VPNPAFLAWRARIKTAYDTAKEVFTRDMTASAARLIDPRNRRVEHLALTNPETSTKDALAFVWEWARTAEAKTSSRKGKEGV